MADVFACLVTGGAQGIGEAFVRKLVSRGLKVVIGDLNVTAGEKLAQELGGSAIFVKCDACSGISLQDCYNASRKTFNMAIKLVVNNAGIAMKERPMFEGQEENAFVDESWRRLIEVDLNAVILGTQVAMKNGSQIVVNVASMAGLLLAPGSWAYTAAKHGVVGFTKSCEALAMKDDNPVRVCAICPAIVDTPLFDQVFGFSAEEGRKNGMQVLSTEQLANALVKLVFEDGAPPGAVMAVTVERGVQYAWPPDLRPKSKSKAKL